MQVACRSLYSWAGTGKLIISMLANDEDWCGFVHLWVHQGCSDKQSPMLYSRSVTYFVVDMAPDVLKSTLQLWH